MLSRVWCVGIAFRLARCSFCAGLRIHATRVCTYARTHVHTYDAKSPTLDSSLVLSLSRNARFSRLALSLTSLFVSAARSSRVSPSSQLENSMKRKCDKGTTDDGFLSTVAELWRSRAAGEFPIRYLEK